MYTDDLTSAINQKPATESGAENPDQQPDPVQDDKKMEALRVGKPVENWTDQEVLRYYDARLAGKSIEALSSTELEIAVRYGNIAKQNREQAEETGFQAEVEAVRRQVSVQVNRYATAALLEEYQKRAFTDLARGGEVDEVRIAVFYKNRKIELGATEVAAAFGGFANAKVRDFNKGLEAVLALIKATATQHRNRIERQKGRDWSKFTSDIRWSATVNEMRNADNGEPI